MSENVKCSIDQPCTAMNCLVKLYDKYNRAKVMEFYCDETARIKCKIFFCDLGQLIDNVNLSDVVAIPDYLIEFLPFQVIKKYNILYSFVIFLQML